MHHAVFQTQSAEIRIERTPVVRRERQPPIGNVILWPVRNGPGVRTVYAQSRLHAGAVHDFHEHRLPTVLLDFHRLPRDRFQTAIRRDFNAGHAERIEKPLRLAGDFCFVGFLMKCREPRRSLHGQRCPDSNKCLRESLSQQQQRLGIHALRHRQRSGIRLP